MQIKKGTGIFKFISLLIISTIMCSLLFKELLHTKDIHAALVNIPEPTKLLRVSQIYSYPMLRGIRFDKNNPLSLTFLVDGADKNSVDQAEVTRLVEYFMAAVTIPTKDIWVNLSPFEEDRIVSDTLAKTPLGRDMLAQDYVLKQFVSSLTYPESQIGKKYWKEVYARVDKKLGTKKVPVDTYHKVCIVPEHAQVKEDANEAYIEDAWFKIMMEKDYLAMKNAQHLVTFEESVIDDSSKTATDIAVDVMKEQLLGHIADEVNYGHNFALLRQIYHSIVLGLWFKRRFKDSLYSGMIDQKKISGIAIEDNSAKEKIYSLYVKAHQKGVYDYIKSTYDEYTKEYTSRRYCSGGIMIELGGKFGNWFVTEQEENPMINNADGNHQADFDILPKDLAKEIIVPNVKEDSSFKKALMGNDVAIESSSVKLDFKKIFFTAFAGLIFLLSPLSGSANLFGQTDALVFTPSRRGAIVQGQSNSSSDTVISTVSSQRATTYIGGSSLNSDVVSTGSASVDTSTTVSVVSRREGNLSGQGAAASTSHSRSRGGSRVHVKTAVADTTALNSANIQSPQTNVVSPSVSPFPQRAAVNVYEPNYGLGRRVRRILSGRALHDWYAQLTEKAPDTNSITVADIVAVIDVSDLSKSETFNAQTAVEQDNIRKFLPNIGSDPTLQKYDSTMITIFRELSGLSPSVTIDEDLAAALKKARFYQIRKEPKKLFWSFIISWWGMLTPLMSVFIRLTFINWRKPNKKASKEEQKEIVDLQKDARNYIKQSPMQRSRVRDARQQKFIEKKQREQLNVILNRIFAEDVELPNRIANVNIKRFFCDVDGNHVKIAIDGIETYNQYYDQIRESIMRAVEDKKLKFELRKLDSKGRSIIYPVNFEQVSIDMKIDDSGSGGARPRTTLVFKIADSSNDGQKVSFVMTAYNSDEVMLNVTEDSEYDFVLKSGDISQNELRSIANKNRIFLKENKITKEYIRNLTIGKEDVPDTFRLMAEKAELMAYKLSYMLKEGRKKDDNDDEEDLLHDKFAKVDYFIQLARYCRTVQYKLDAYVSLYKKRTPYLWLSHPLEKWPVLNWFGRFGRLTSGITTAYWLNKCIIFNGLEDIVNMGNELYEGLYNGREDVYGEEKKTLTARQALQEDFKELIDDFQVPRKRADGDTNEREERYVKSIIGAFKNLLWPLGMALVGAATFGLPGFFIAWTMQSIYSSSSYAKKRLTLYEDSMSRLKELEDATHFSYDFDETKSTWKKVDNYFDKFKAIFENTTIETYRKQIRPPFWVNILYYGGMVVAPFSMTIFAITTWVKNKFIIKPNYEQAKRKVHNKTLYSHFMRGFSQTKKKSMAWANMPAQQKAEIIRKNPGYNDQPDHVLIMVNGDSDRDLLKKMRDDVEHNFGIDPSLIKFKFIKPGGKPFTSSRFMLKTINEVHENLKEKVEYVDKARTMVIDATYDKEYMNLYVNEYINGMRSPTNIFEDELGNPISGFCWQIHAGVRAIQKMNKASRGGMVFMGKDAYVGPTNAEEGLSIYTSITNEDRARVKGHIYLDTKTGRKMVHKTLFNRLAQIYGHENLQNYDLEKIAESLDLWVRDDRYDFDDPKQLQYMQQAEFTTICGPMTKYFDFFKGTETAMSEVDLNLDFNTGVLQVLNSLYENQSRRAQTDQWELNNIISEDKLSQARNLLSKIHDVYYTSLARTGFTSHIMEPTPSEAYVATYSNKEQLAELNKKLELGRASGKRKYRKAPTAAVRNQPSKQSNVANEKNDIQQKQKENLDYAESLIVQLEKVLIANNLKAANIHEYEKELKKILDHLAKNAKKYTDTQRAESLYNRAQMSMNYINTIKAAQPLDDLQKQMPVDMPGGIFLDNIEIGLDQPEATITVANHISVGVKVELFNQYSLKLVSLQKC